MTAAAALYDEQVQITRAAVTVAEAAWSNLDPSRLSASWIKDRIGQELFLITARAQELAAASAESATDVILAEGGGSAGAAEARLNTRALAGIASDGRDLNDLLTQPLIRTNVAQASGVGFAQSKQMGLNALVRIVGTQVQDVGRTASGIAIAARPRTGWVRLVEPRACARCAVLAGRWYRWSSGFLRHPACGCRNIPASEDTPRLTRSTDPNTLFHGLTEEEQNRQFTKAGAKAIRDGADISRVVNSRRGALGLSSPGQLTSAEQRALRNGGPARLKRTDVYGQKVFTTTEATSKRAGIAAVAGGKTPRLMPESIYDIAEDRADAVRLLTRFGYIR